MQRIGEHVLFSPSDLNQFLECGHLTQLELERDPSTPRGEREPQAELLAEKGSQHEREWLQRFRAEGRDIISIESAGAERDWLADAERTRHAMRRGASVIYQGAFVDGNWHGISDFLVRVERPSDLGTWSYEAWDTKLARRSKPYFVLQLCFYTEQLARIQGVTPQHMVIVLGTGEHERLNYRDFDSYYRAVRDYFVAEVQARRPTYPYPVEHCALCGYRRACERRWQEADHLSLVADIRRDQVERLNAVGVETVAGLADIDVSRRIGIGDVALGRLRQQAALQTEFRITSRHRYELLPLDERTGFRLLPQSSEGDVFFDMEADPYFEPGRGLEYLFGVMTIDNEAVHFEARQGLDRKAEKAAFEWLIDFLQDRLRRWPDFHVYHYASYETAALKRLMSEHATREDEFDDLLRREVFVDLYQVIRQSLRLSHPSYSIKSVRSFFMPEAGQGMVASGGDSILEFERWRRTGDAKILQAITAYNREDCLSTVKLREWLLERKAEAEKMFGQVVPWKPVGVATVSEKREAIDALTQARVERLRALGTQEAVLVADLLNYHRREAKPEWWAYFERHHKSLDDLMEDTEAIAYLNPASDELPVPDKKSTIIPMDFPDQEFKLTPHPKNQLEDPFRGVNAGAAIRIDSARGRLYLRRGPKAAVKPLPSALVKGQPIPDMPQRDALGRLADEIAAGGHCYRAVRAVLTRDLPRIQGRRIGNSLQTSDLDTQKALVTLLDESYLFIQGPPGSGKTWTGARLIMSLIADGRRVGVAALSHKAINNLLKEVEKVAVEMNVTFAGLKKCGDEDDRFDGRFVENTMDNEDCEISDAHLIAGTSWLFSREAMYGRIDYLFIDEAGQLSLADTVAMGTTAKNLVLLGDPQQLPQIQQGVHSTDAGRSALEHLLLDAATVAEDRGVFQERTYRMHPAVCSYISELAYDGRLRSADGCERQIIVSKGLKGAGIRYIHVHHQGNAQASREEADTIRCEVELLLADGTFTDAEGVTRSLTPADILVVAPYNMQVRCLREYLPAGVDVGTVDKFQGREAPVVFFSMASSSDDEVPRGLEFLFSQNRLNVAISRARALAVVVCSPTLLRARCNHLDQMRLVNNLCRFAEHARGAMPLVT
jgi:predicted RecB family nuclease